MKKILFSIIAATSIFAFSRNDVAYAINIKAQNDTPYKVRMSIQTPAGLAKNLKLSLAQSSENMSEDKKQKALSNLNKLRKDQVPMTSMVYEPDESLIIASTGKDMTINHKYSGERGETSFVITSRDKKTGEAVGLTKDDILVMTQGGQVIPAEVRDFEEAKAPMVVTLLIDTSGSMKDHIHEVVTAAKDLIKQLPNHMVCHVITFGHEVSDLGNDENNRCSPGNFSFADVRADGKTYLFGAFKHGLSKMNSTKFSEHQRAIITLTDGAPSDQDTDAYIQKLKSDTPSVMFWLGTKSPEAEKLLRPYADNFVTDSKSAMNELNAYFDVLATGTKTQTVVTIKTGAQLSKAK